MAGTKLRDPRKKGATLRHPSPSGWERGPVREVLQVSPTKGAPGGAELGPGARVGPAPAEAQGWVRGPESGPAQEPGPRPPPPTPGSVGLGFPSASSTPPWPAHPHRVRLTCAAASHLHRRLSPAPRSRRGGRGPAPGHRPTARDWLPAAQSEGPMRGPAFPSGAPEAGAFGVALAHCVAASRRRMAASGMQAPGFREAVVVPPAR